MNRSFVLALALVGCHQAHAQSRQAPRPVRPATRADAGTARSDASAATDAARPASGPLSRANVRPLYPNAPVTSNWEPRCTAMRGCAAAQAVARCAPGLAARTFADVVDNRATLAGQRVAVRANLTPTTGCSEMGCGPNACCNFCGGPVHLTGAGQAGSRTIDLSADPQRHPDPLFACRGDDSGVCCGIDARGQEVIAQGILRPVPNGNGTHYLESPTLCTP